MSIRLLATLSIVVATFSASGAGAEESQIANDRTALLIRIESDRFVMPQYIRPNGAPAPGGQDPLLSKYLQEIKASPWNIQAIGLNPEELANTPLSVSRCKGTMSTPLLDNRRIGPTDYFNRSSKAMAKSNTSLGQQFGWDERNDFEWTYGPCYWIATTQYVEDRIRETVPAYFEDKISESAIANQERQIIELQRENDQIRAEMRELSYRINAIEKEQEK